MKKLDNTFWINLRKLHLLKDDLIKILDYSANKEPLDLDDIKEGLPGLKQIDKFDAFSLELETKVLEMLTIAEFFRELPSMLKENFSEKENEMLPDEGTRTGALLGE